MTMERARLGKRRPPCTARGGVALVAILAFTPVAAQSPGGQTEVTARGTFALQPLSQLPQTRERPLFSVGRRPPPAAAAVAPSPPPPPIARPPAAAPPAAVLILTGIAHGPDRRVAILRNAGTNAVNRVEKGQVVDGWSVEDIDTRSVVLRKNSTTQRLELFPAPAPKR